MAYQPTFEGEFDVAVDLNEDLAQFLESLTATKIILVSWQTNGPVGTPCVVLRGTRRQFTNWFDIYYDEARNTRGEVEDGETSEAAEWVNAVDAFGLKCIA